MNDQARLALKMVLEAWEANGPNGDFGQNLVAAQSDPRLAPEPPAAPPAVPKACAGPAKQACLVHGWRPEPTCPHCAHPAPVPQAQEKHADYAALLAAATLAYETLLWDSKDSVNLNSHERHIAGKRREAIASLKPLVQP